MTERCLFGPDVNCFDCANSGHVKIEVVDRCCECGDNIWRCFRTGFEFCENEYCHRYCWTQIDPEDEDTPRCGNGRGSTL